MSYEVEPVVVGGAVLGEGPVWDDRAAQLLWVDIGRHEVHRFDPATGHDTADRYAEPVTALAPSAHGTPLAAVGRRVTPLDSPAGPLAILPTGDRANDGKCDPAGRFLVGTLTAAQTPGSCALYRIDGPGQITVLVDGVTLANGLDWSPAGDRLYFVDTPTLRIDMFDYDPDSGTATGRRPFVDLTGAPGRPDGLTVDAEGGVWVAVVRGNEIRRYDDRGRLDEVIAMPTPLVTSCAFGGPGLDELYVTSGTFAMTGAERAADPLAGALFRLRPKVTGKPPNLWRPVTV